MPVIFLYNKRKTFLNFEASFSQHKKNSISLFLIHVFRNKKNEIAIYHNLELTHSFTWQHYQKDFYIFEYNSLTANIYTKKK